MSSPFRPSGIYSAQWLPVDSAGRLDRAGLATHLAFEKASGIAGVLGLGSTGEFPHFSPDERKLTLAGHATKPTCFATTRELLIGAEDGFFYQLANPRAK